jgi:competence protein ComEC
MELFFLDVGQASCNIILLGENRAIVIDSGSGKGSLPLKFLKRCRVERIEALVVTHSHADHIGGATSILGDYSDCIDRIWFVDDGSFTSSAFYSRIRTLIDEGVLSRRHLCRLECGIDPLVVWEDPSRNAAARVFAPLAIQNLIATEANKQNATSAVLVLDYGSKRIVFGADSQLAEWRDIHERYGTIRCDVLSVPHHGGHIDIDDSNIEWLYNEAIKADVAVVSVATTSKSHPRPEVVRSLKVSGAHIMCSQISNRCTTDLENARSNGIPLLHSSASTPTRTVKPTKSRSGRVRQRSVRVPCAGTVRAELNGDTITVDSISEHRAFVNNLPTEPVCPMCRMASS